MGDFEHRLSWDDVKLHVFSIGTFGSPLGMRPILSPETDTGPTQPNALGGPGMLLATWLWVKNQWYHFGVGAPPILEPILVGIGMFTGGTI